jgi:hypothetical protein
MGKLTTDARFARLERISAMLATERFGSVGQPGPMDPDWRLQRQRVQADLAAIMAEQREPELETRGAE